MNPEPNYRSDLPPRHTTCARCFVSLQSAATIPLCDDCDGAPEPPTQIPKPPTPALRVVHSGATVKRAGGHERFDYWTPAPNGMPPRQTPQETA
ncbi:hypothetical protein OKHIL_16980 [Mycolicibacterium mageritense]